MMLLVGVLTTARAQFSEETKTAGGSIGYFNSSNRQPDGRDTRFSRFSLNLKGGYFLQDNLEAGLQVGLDASNHEWDYNTSIERLSSSTFIIGPYARLYNPLTAVVALFGEAGFKLGFGGSSGSSSGDTKIRTFSIGLRPGVSLMVNENLGLETSIGLIGYDNFSSGSKENYEDTRVTSGIFQAGFSLSDILLGFRLYLTD